MIFEIVNNLLENFLLSYFISSFIKMKYNKKKFIIITMIINMIISTIMTSYYLVGIEQTLVIQLCIWICLYLFHDDFSFQDIAVALFCNLMLFISVYAMTILCNSLFETHFFNSFSSQTKYEINIILEKIFYFTSLSFLLKRKLPFLKKDAPYINYLISFEFFIMFIMAYYFLVNILNNIPNISNHLVFIGFLVLIIIFNIVFNKLIESNELLLKTKLKEQENKYIRENLNYIKTIKYDVNNIEHRMNYILQSIEYDLINEDYLEAIHKIKAQKETVLSISPIIVTNNETFDFILNLEIKSLLQDGKEIKTCISISENAVYNHPVAAYRITKLLKYIYNFYQHVELFIAEKEDTSLEVKFIIPHYLELSSSFEEELNTFDDYSISIIKNDETMIIQYIDSLSSYH